jgi:hypothetical protein
VNYEDYENILEVYTLEQILEENDLTEADALEFMHVEHFLELPKVRPV